METMIDEAIKKFQSNAEYERTHGNLQGCLEFRQLVEWLRKLQKIEQIVKEWEVDHESMVDSMDKISGVIENGYDD